MDMHSKPVSGKYRRDISPDSLARGLGWFGIGLGLAEMLMSKSAFRASGIPGKSYGVREIINGVGVLSAKDPTPWIWARVGGDVMDLATIAVRGRGPIGVTALVAVAGATVLDIACAQSLEEEKSRPAAPMRDYSDRSGMPLPADEMRGAAKRPLNGASDQVQAPVEVLSTA